MKRLVKIQKDDEGQFVCIPAEFDFPGDDAVMRKVGDRLIIEPVRPKPRPSLSTDEALDGT